MPIIQVYSENSERNDIYVPDTISLEQLFIKITQSTASPKAIPVSEIKINEITYYRESLAAATTTFICTSEMAIHIIKRSPLEEKQPSHAAYPMPNTLKRKATAPVLQPTLIEEQKVKPSKNTFFKKPKSTQTRPVTPEPDYSLVFRYSRTSLDTQRMMIEATQRDPEHYKSFRGLTHFNYKIYRDMKRFINQQYPLMSLINVLRYDSIFSMGEWLDLFPNLMIGTHDLRTRRNNKDKRVAKSSFYALLENHNAYKISDWIANDDLISVPPVLLTSTPTLSYQDTFNDKPLTRTVIDLTSPTKLDTEIVFPPIDLSSSTHKLDAKSSTSTVIGSSSSTYLFSALELPTSPSTTPTPPADIFSSQEYFITEEDVLNPDYFKDPEPDPEVSDLTTSTISSLFKY